jgi:hypothetical protein
MNEDILAVPILPGNIPAATNTNTTPTTTNANLVNVNLDVRAASAEVCNKPFVSENTIYYIK